ncbi:hypothetical protein FH972_021958 [Carpinus fangiana]|uniref:Enoyl-CoA hydratase n=1 Tax=Carpinus fangiana TaxID=176857 RepID=A0A5N6KRE4_9ROSI|nr:hypothetical protein FH972_021958 [Carpinus fangiana]
MPPLPPPVSLPKSYNDLKFEEIRVSHHPASSPDPTPVIIVTLYRPKNYNAFTDKMCEELERIYALLSIDDRVKAVVMTGHGRMYCAGADLNQGFKLDGSLHREAETEKTHRDGGGRVALAIHHCAKPVIGAIQGAAVGVGITMTLPMTIRVGWAKAKIGFVFARRGLVSEGASSFFLPRLIGHGKAMHLVTTGLTYPADHKLLDGLFTEITEKQEEVLPRALEIADDIVKNTSSVSNFLISELMWRGPLSAEETHLLDSKILFGLRSSVDNEEGVKSFLEKRPVKFTGSVQRDAPPAYPWHTPINVLVKPGAAEHPKPKFMTCHNLLHPFSVPLCSHPNQRNDNKALNKGGRPGGGEELGGCLLGNTVGEGELEALLDDLLDVRPPEISGLLNLNDLQDLEIVLATDFERESDLEDETYVDRPETRAVTRGHVLVEGLDSIRSGQLTVLLVHVVGSRTYCIDGDDFTVGLLGLSETRQEIPEAGLGDNVVGRKDAHAVELGSRVGLGRQKPTDDLVFLEATFENQQRSAAKSSQYTTTSYPDLPFCNQMTPLHPLLLDVLVVAKSLRNRLHPVVCHSMGRFRYAAEDAFSIRECVDWLGAENVAVGETFCRVSRTTRMLHSATNIATPVDLSFFLTHSIVCRRQDDDQAQPADSAQPFPQGLAALRAHALQPGNSHLSLRLREVAPAALFSTDGLSLSASLVENICSTNNPLTRYQIAWQEGLAPHQACREGCKGRSSSHRQAPPCCAMPHP